MTIGSRVASGRIAQPEALYALFLENTRRLVDEVIHAEGHTPDASLRQRAEDAISLVGRVARAPGLPELSPRPAQSAARLERNLRLGRAESPPREPFTLAASSMSADAVGDETADPENPVADHEALNAALFGLLMGAFPDGASQVRALMNAAGFAAFLQQGAAARGTVRDVREGLHETLRGLEAEMGALFATPEVPVSAVYDVPPVLEGLSLDDLLRHILTELSPDSQRPPADLRLKASRRMAGVVLARVAQAPLDSQRWNTAALAIGDQGWLGELTQTIASSLEGVNWDIQARLDDGLRSAMSAVTDGDQAGRINDLALLYAVAAQGARVEDPEHRPLADIVAPHSVSALLAWYYARELGSVVPELTPADRAILNRAIALHWEAARPMVVRVDGVRNHDWPVIPTLAPNLVGVARDVEELNWEALLNRLIGGLAVREQRIVRLVFGVDHVSAARANHVAIALEHVRDSWNAPSLWSAVQDYVRLARPEFRQMLWDLQGYSIASPELGALAQLQSEPTEQRHMVRRPTNVFRQRLQSS